MFNRQHISITNRFAFRCVMAVACTFFNHTLHAQATDTLPEVKLSSVKYPDVSASAVPVQQLNKESLSHINSLSVAEAVKYFSGVSVKDYGGIGGLKTVSVRSLGANHTGIMYDGILLSDAQGGQIDLGKLSLGNIESISLYNSQPGEILLPARSFASASILSLRSAQPAFNAEKKWGIKATVKAGSFGFVAPALTLQYHFSKKFYNSISAEWQRADGTYPFSSYAGNGETLKRSNTDIDALRLEYDAGYKINDSNIIRFKTYYYNSERGLPGSVIVINNFNDERLSDRNFFSQASWGKSFNAASRLLLSGKYTYNYNYYIDPTYPNTQGKMENKFHQKEYYFSGAYSYRFSGIFSAAYASDYFISTLTRSDEFAEGFVTPTRNTWLNNISLKAVFSNIEIQANLLHNSLKEKVKTGIPGKDINVFTPALALSYQPVAAVPLRLRAFYKRIFRAPTFNDLYYTFIGNSDLRPEYATQYNAGITYRHSRKGFIRSAIFTADAYYNKVKDKIVAVPRQNLFQWTMLNLAHVDIRGLDAAVQLYTKEINAVTLSARLSYTYQRAVDKSDKTSEEYNKQIPYTPEHSGSINFNAAYKKLSLGYNVLLSGYRYRLGEQTAENLVKEWATQDVSFTYDMGTKPGKYRATLELNNIFNKQYEIIRYYPMPRFNYRLGFIAEL